MFSRFSFEPQELRAKLGAADDPEDNEANNLHFKGEATSSNARPSVENGTTFIKRPELCPGEMELEEINRALAENIYDTARLERKSESPKNGDCRFENADAAYDAAEEYLERIDDPFTRLIRPEEARDFLKLFDGKAGGIGVSVMVPDSAEKIDSPGSGLLEIEKVLNGSPAEEAGLKQGDRIEKIDGKPLSEKSFRESIDLLRGEEGSEVNLEIQREGELLEMNLKRTTLDLPAVFEKKLENGITYLAIPSFEQDDTAREFQDIVLKNSDARAFIIDLRDNGGGLESQATAIASMIVGNGRIFSHSRRLPSSKVFPIYENLTESVDENGTRVDSNLAPATYYPARNPDLIDKPLVVLVNSNSASASEILTAALKENGEATIIGEKTFGKGIGQTVIPLDSGGILLVTSQKYLTPKGNWLGDGHDEKHGIEPDIEVRNPHNSIERPEDDRQLNVAVKYLESLL